MGIFNWLRGRRPTLTDGAFWAQWFGASNWAGRTVTPDSSLNISAWWRSTKLYAEVTASLPLKFYERGASDERKAVKDHPVKSVISIDPNDEMTTWEFWASQAASLAMLGNSFAEKRMLGDRLISLEPLPPDQTRPYRTVGGDLRYKFTDRGREEDLPADKVFHTRAFSFGGDLGLSPLAYARQTLGIAMATEEAAGRGFAQGMRASGVFAGPAKMTPVQMQQFRDNYIKPAEGVENEGKSIILPPEFKWFPMSIPPKDAEMLMSRKFNVEDVCRWMGVPPILVGHAAEGQTMWGTGVENILLSWLTLGLDAFLSSIERSINKRLILPAERGRYYAEFDRNGLLRADSAARGEFITKMIGAAQMTPNEGRRKENMPSLPGGDQLFINSTYVPIDQAGRKDPAEGLIP